MLIIPLSSALSLPTDYDFLSFEIPSTNLQVIEGSPEPSYRNKGNTATREGLNTMLFSLTEKNDKIEMIDSSC